MIDEKGIFLGASPSASGPQPQYLNLRRANRHGLIAGATGTGKTVTLQGIAENFSAAGVPVFLADVKGDLAGIAMAGSPTAKNADKLVARAAEIGLEPFTWGDNPAIFWDLYGEQGHPIRTTVSEMGPLLLARLMNLNEVQEGVLNIAFRYADEEGLLLLDLGDLQAMLAYCAENAEALSARFGNVTKPSVGSIQRQLLQLDSQGGAHFFGEPALDIHDFLGVDDQGRGYVNVLAADKLMQSPKLYATFLLWLLSELFETLPEVGDPDKPRLVFFFDEAHLLFEDAPKALTDKIEQVVRLIRSKGVGVYFVTQNPIDIPEDVAAQLGNRVQHALRAFTPRDQKAIEAAADTFRINPDLDVAKAIIELKVGEALVSVLQDDGSPSIVQRTLIAPPRSRLGPLDAKEREIIQSISPVAGKYDTVVDRESAEEILAARGNAAAAAAQAAKAQVEADKAAAIQAKAEAKQQEQALKEKARQDAIAAREAAKPTGIDRAIQSATRAAASSVGRQVANELGRAVFGGGRRNAGGGIAGQLVRGILGGLFK
ncbi:ATP-binding protein [Sphingomonas sp. Root710]|uniref:helicase HerA-like domain-containing protein n=1 Tax=Sphingomonas sp. Root710 TaxID=1736594 RepID=UPI0006F6220F|nr:helicase HerA-like domain-containing protein [Sphingomonas sp. Root710]KRB85080.1 ATP-binding protein [Sphingomonas sp. Root710]